MALQHKRFKLPLKCSTSDATYNDDRWLFVGLGVGWEGFVIFTLPLVRRQIRFFLPERDIVSLFHAATVTVVNY